MPTTTAIDARDPMATRSSTLRIAACCHHGLVELAGDQPRNCPTSQEAAEIVDAVALVLVENDRLKVSLSYERDGLLWRLPT